MSLDHNLAIVLKAGPAEYAASIFYQDPESGKMRMTEPHPIDNLEQGFSTLNEYLAYLINIIEIENVLTGENDLAVEPVSLMNFRNPEDPRWTVYHALRGIVRSDEYMNKFYQRCYDQYVHHQDQKGKGVWKN